MTTPIETHEYVSHQKVLICVGDDPPVRFWLPKDRPLKYIIEAILSAEPAPFRDLDVSIAYDLFREQQHQAEDALGEEAVIDQSLDLLRLQLGAAEVLRLVRRSLPKASITFQDHDQNNWEWPLSPGLVIGNSKNEHLETARMLDLYPYVQGDWTNNISRRHAQVIDHNRHYYLEVLHSHGVWADNTRYDKGKRIRLVNGMKITIVQLEMFIRFEE